MPLRVTVILVSYNTRDLLRQALQTLEAENPHEIIVVDNASQDGSPQMVAKEFPEVRLVANDANQGFGPANNQALDEMTGDLALFLNSDARPKPGAIARLAQTFESHPQTVAAGGSLVFPDGRLQESACNPLTLWAVFCEQTLLEKLFPRSSLLSPYWVSARIAGNGPGPHEVAQVMGACLMARPLERFDERFFLYCEDTELCRRLQAHGKILYVPEAVFEHELGASSANTRWQAVARYNRGKELYFKIHNGRFIAFMCWIFNRKGALLRLLAWTLLIPFKRSARHQVALFWRVLTAPVTGPPLPPDSSPKPTRPPRPS